MTGTVVAAPSLQARQWTPADTEQLVQWFADDPTLWQYMPGRDQAPTEAELRTHAAARFVQEAAGQALQLAVERDGRLACQFVIYPLVGEEGSCHVLIAPWAHGHGIALLKAAIAEAQRRGVRKIVGLPSSKLPLDVYLRFMRRVGFTIKFYGEIAA